MNGGLFLEHLACEPGIRELGTDARIALEKSLHASEPERENNWRHHTLASGLTLWLSIRLMHPFAFTPS
jgi:hypothetical protein